jgi:peptidoglycan/LPS O-acetylase OafA/YrhL/CubicO group peptidase (beta-lactamase class C family)
VRPSEADTSARRRPPNAHLPYLPGLDGLRALAVTGVLIYHAGLGLRGGFLGVEAFFVLSGYLITALLLAEWQRDGQINLLAFWRRRARRLLPMLGVVLVGTLGLSALFVPAELAEVGADTLAVLGYVTNWWLVLRGQPYFDPMLRPPLLQHLWSLAVEEQFYLAWPILFALGMRHLHRRGFLLAVLVGAAASIARMAALYQPGDDPSRLYYGTDTRAAGLLLGAALALVWMPNAMPGATRRRLGLALDGAGIFALITLLVAAIWLVESHPLLYRGGFALVALATSIVIAAVTHPQARVLPRLLGVAPLRWIGLRSYGIYLWHWPIFMLSRPLLATPFNEGLVQALRVAVVVILADLCYRAIEAPIRRGALSRVGRALTRGVNAVPGATRLIGDARRLNDLIRTRITTTTQSSSRPVWLRVLSAMLIFGSVCASPASAPLPATSSRAMVTLASAAPDRASVAHVPMVPTSDRPPASTPTVTLRTTDTSAPTPSATPIPIPQPFDPALAQELQRILDEAVADGDTPGAVLAVRLPGREPWTGASGIADIDQGQPMEPTTKVRIGSISKVFTAVVVLQLVEEGRIALDDPVATYLPDLLPNGDRVTVRQLLNHTTGLYDYLEDWDFVNRAYEDPAYDWAPEELVGYALEYPLAFSPGAEGMFDYSSTNYVILGMIVEHVTGASLAESVRTRILDPLQLTQTFVVPDEDVPGMQARGYYRSVDQMVVGMSFAFATANIVSTADDVRRFADALFGGQLLHDEAFGAMTTFIDAHGQYDMPELEYGLGMMRARLPVGPGADGQPRTDSARTVVGHIGGFGGFRSAVWHVPESGVTIALGVNQATTDPNVLTTRVLEAILAQQSP